MRGVSFWYTSMMATRVYKSYTIADVYGNEIYLTPLKIKYLREFMDEFDRIKDMKGDAQTITQLCNCVRVAMKQYKPEIKTTEDVEDTFDMKTLYTILDIAAGVKLDEKPEDKPKKDSGGTTWATLDLAKLEAEVFQIGIWKDYEDLESSLSMTELMITLESKRELDYNEKKFLAGLQGINLDEKSGKKDEWEEMKARVFSGGKARDANDIMALQGPAAAKAGLGIGNGIGYERW